MDGCYLCLLFVGHAAADAIAAAAAALQ